MEHRPYEEAVQSGLSLTEAARRLRKEARGVPPGIERDRLIRRARRAETAADMQERFKPPVKSPSEK